MNVATVAFRQEQVRDFFTSLEVSSATDIMKTQLQIQREIAKRLFDIEEESMRFCELGRSNGIAAEYCLGLYHITGGAISLFQMIVREPRLDLITSRTQNTYDTVSYLAEQFPVPQPVFACVECPEDRGLIERINTQGTELVEEIRHLFDPNYVYQWH